MARPRRTDHDRRPGILGSTHHADNRDIAEVLDEYEAQVSVSERRLSVVPDVDLLVGGFPCQDYSVAKTLRQAHGSSARRASSGGRSTGFASSSRRPPIRLFLENVDRLLKSPAHQRGRDFAVMLASLADLGYEVEWRVVNAADYGFPQKRRRVFIIGRLATRQRRLAHGSQMLVRDGVLARALPVGGVGRSGLARTHARRPRRDLSETFGRGSGAPPSGTPA